MSGNRGGKGGESLQCETGPSGEIYCETFTPVFFYKNKYFFALQLKKKKKLLCLFSHLISILVVTTRAALECARVCVCLCKRTCVCVCVFCLDRQIKYLLILRGGQGRGSCERSSGGLMAF